MTLLFLLLGLFGGLGYHVSSVKEVSFVPNNFGLYADAVFQCDITFNPVLYPFYWVVGAGHLEGNFSMVFIPEGLMPGEYGGPVWGRPATRADIYVTRVITWGTIGNAVLLLVLAIFIEVIGKRVLFLAIFTGTLGFRFGGLAGALGGLCMGAFVIAYVLRKPEDNVLERFWRSLWD